MVLAGEYRGGLIPFGFDAVYLGRVNKKGQPVRDLVINEAEAAIKAQVYHLIVDMGFGGARIADWLNARGIKTKRGKSPWCATAVRAMIGNPLDRGQMHLGEVLSEPIDELRIIDDYYYYKAIEIIRCRNPKKPDQLRGPLRTDAGGLLTGLLYCAHCGGRLTINHCSKKVDNSAGRHEYYWDVYRCYRRMGAKAACTGQSTYNALRIEDVVINTVNAFFARIKRTPQESQLRAAMLREETTQRKVLADAAEAVEKEMKGLAAIEEQALKALKGENQLDLENINQLMTKQKRAVEMAQEEYQRILMVNQAEEESLNNARIRVQKMADWADIFQHAPMSQKRMILAEIIDRIEIGKGYKINIKFKMTVSQFIDPDGNAAKDQKVS